MWGHWPEDSHQQHWLYKPGATVSVNIFPISILLIDLSLSLPHCTLSFHFVFLNLIKSCWFRHSGGLLSLNSDFGQPLKTLLMLKTNAVTTEMINGRMFHLSRPARYVIENLIKLSVIMLAKLFPRAICLVIKIIFKDISNQMVFK